VEGEGSYQLAHTVDPDGAVDRLMLFMWGRLIAPRGRSYDPQPPDAGHPVVAGRVFAEHVFTRPFAPAAERKVRALDAGGRPFVPEARADLRAPETVLALPDGAEPLDTAPVPDDAPTVLGLDHTDSNQHVNSLVYPRLVIEAALRRFHALGRGSSPLLARGLEIAFRRPCFAGERVRVVSRAFAWGDRLGVTATITADGDPAGSRPRCTARVVFDAGAGRAFASVA
jgi:acyl-CoA thioesterase FadM